jgi:hypothetical protein
VQEGARLALFEARGLAGGRIERLFNGKTADRAEARSWLASILPEVWREARLEALARNEDRR